MPPPYSPHRPSADPHSGPELPENLIDQCLASLGPKATEAQLAACVFDLRRGMVSAVAHLALSGPNAPTGTAHDAIDEGPQEDLLRDSLPPLLVSAGPYVPVFSAWRGAVAAVLGLIFGSALAQGLSLTAGGAVLLSTAGMALGLWLADVLARAAALGVLHLPRQKSVGWKKLRRWSRIVWAVLLVLALLRDFLQQNPLLQHILEALSAFLTQGIALYLVQNIYCALALVALFVMVSQRPVRLDVAEYGLRLRMVAETWWTGAVLVREALLAQHEARYGKHNQLRQKVGQELYSFAAELPSAQSFWLQERLRMLGFGTSRVEKELVWTPHLAAQYDALGHVEEGAKCFVDTPPLMDGDVMVRKGTVRKIRV